MFSGLQWGKFLIKISIYDIFIVNSLRLQLLCVIEFQKPCCKMMQPPFLGLK